MTPAQDPTSPPPPERPLLLLVTGAGRSGTSTVAGTLARLGFVVPQPEVPADETNPRGFYEPKWAVDFHKRVLGSVPIRTNDTRPEAVTSAAENAARPDLLEEVTAWLESLVAEPRVVVKDPRTFWLHDLWRNAADEAGFELGFLTMLRHPAQVASSRDKHYLSDRDEAFRSSRRTANVAAWCHGILVTEKVTRADARRTFVRYAELMSDWRSAMGRSDQQLGAGVMGEVGQADHAVDDFIDVGLNRSTVDWEELAVRPEVSDLAERIWTVVDRLVDDPWDETAMTALDELHERYDRLYGLAHDLTLDQRNVDRELRRKAERALVRSHRQQMKQRHRRLKDLERRNQELTAELENLHRSRALRAARAVRRVLPRR